MKSTAAFSWFRKIAFVEGVSFLVLLLIAMPLKYFAGLPLAVRVIGGLHGVLFIAFIAMAWITMNRYNRNWGWLIKAFISSLIPFGTFWMDRQWKKEEESVRLGQHRL